MTMSAPAIRRQVRRDQARVTVLRVVIVVAIAAVWEGVSRFGVLNPRDFPPFTDVCVAFAAELVQGSTWWAIGNTVLGWVIAMLIAVVVGIVVGLLIGPSRFLTGSTSLIIDVLRSTPAPAVIFVLILLLGTSLGMKVGLASFAAVFPILIQTLYGVRGVDPVLRDLQRSYRISPWVGFTRIRLPASLSYIATGVRVAASICLIVTVVGEYLGGADGVGSLVDEVRRTGDFPRMYALILLVGFLSVGLNAAVGAGEKRVLWWHPSQRKGQ